jgi:hypothetical protein
MAETPFGLSEAIAARGLKVNNRRVDSRAHSERKIGLWRRSRKNEPRCRLRADVPEGQRP